MMRRPSSVTRVLAASAASIMLLATVGSATAAATSPLGNLLGAAPVDPWLTEQLRATAADDTLRILIHGTDLRSAREGAAKAGLTPLHDLERIGVTIASGTPPQIQLAARQPGVTYVEGDQPLEFFTDSSHEATRGTQAATDLVDHGGLALTGAGASIAVIDTGVDPTHPFFREPDGSSAVVANLKNVCSLVQMTPDSCLVDVGPLVDTDTISAGGHGTHVNGIAAGRPATLTDGTEVRGAAPGAKLVSLSVGAGISIIGADLALEWVLENHATPCGTDVPESECPPIKVTNNSYGPPGGGEFNANSATAKLQRELAGVDVVTVWANGNDGGNGSDNRSNPPGQDPTAGIISAASYYDQDSGTRDGEVAGSSSRGHRNRQSTWPDISAPGQEITSACRPNLPICSTGTDPRNGPGPADVATFNTISGTSMAAPHIAGIVAQLFQAKPDATAGAVEHALKADAHKFTDGAEYEAAGEYTSSYDKGSGLVDTVAAVKELRGSKVPNGSFESSVDGHSPEGWTGAFSAMYDTSGEHAGDGTAAVGVSGVGRWTSDAFGVTAGTTYGVAATVTSAPPSAAPEMRVAFFTASGSPTGIANMAVPSSGELLGTVTAPVGAAQARVTLAGFAASDPAPSGTVWFDDVWLG